MRGGRLDEDLLPVDRAEAFLLVETHGRRVGRVRGDVHLLDAALPRLRQRVPEHRPAESANPELRNIQQEVLQTASGKSGKCPLEGRYNSGF